MTSKEIKEYCLNKFKDMDIEELYVDWYYSPEENRTTTEFGLHNWHKDRLSMIEYHRKYTEIDCFNDDVEMDYLLGIFIESKEPIENLNSKTLIDLWSKYEMNILIEIMQRRFNSTELEDYFRFTIN